MRISVLFSVLLLAACMCISSVAAADVVHLRNGDRLTGEITIMEKDALKLKTGYAGEVTIQWPEVASVESDREMAVYFKDGNMTRGTVSVENGECRVAEEGETRAFEPEKIASINKKPRDYAFTGNVKAGWNKAEGNTRKENVSFAADLAYSLDKNRWKGHGDYYWGESKGKRTDYNWLASAGYDRFLSEDKKLYFNTNGLLQQDQFQDLDLRASLGVGLGYQFFDSDSLTLSLEAGPSYVWEDFISRGSRDYTAGRWALNFGWWAVEKRLQFYHSHFGLVSLEDSEDWIWQSRTGLMFPIIARFFGNFEYDYDWTNKPAPGKEQNDSRIIFSLGYSFSDFPWADDE